MKKIRYILLILLCLLLVGCSQGYHEGDYGGSEDNTSNNVTVETVRKIYYTVTYSISSSNYTEIKKEIEIEVNEFNGYIESSTESDERSVVVYRIPTEKLNEFLDIVDSNGNCVKSKTIESKDVTSSYSALEARKQVLEASRKAYLDMLSKPDITTNDIIALQTKIDEIDTELLTICNELDNYNNLLDYSKITITYNLSSEDESFFVEYVNYLGSFFVVIGQIILYLLPFGLIVGAIIFTIIFIDKKRRNKRINK